METFLLLEAWLLQLLLVSKNNDASRLMHQTECFTNLTHHFNPYLI
jgi:hypothetical protein